MDTQIPQPEYKPNIYPIMYWALVYGIIAATALFAVNLLAGIIALVWFPVFLAGVIWGGYRKYQQDKAAWAQQNGTSPTDPSNTPASPIEEFKNAARDIAKAGQEMITRQAIEDSAVNQAVEEEILTKENAAQEPTAESNAAQQTQQALQEEITTQETALQQVPHFAEASRGGQGKAEDEEPKTPQSPLQPLV